MKTILAALDFSNATDSVVTRASDLTKAVGGTLHLLHVEAPDPEFVGYEPGPQHVRDQVAHAIAQDRHEIVELKDALKAQGLDVHCQILQGPTIEKIIEEAKRLKANFIVVGSHGHSAFHDLVLGSVSDGVIRKSPCPVVVVPHARASR